MITWTSIPVLFYLISSISGTMFVHEDSLPKAMDELLGLFNCSLGTQERIQKCLYEMYDDINDYTWDSSNRVDCCIVAKFQECVMEEDDESCMTGAEYMSPRTILTATSCIDYDQDSFQCHLFFNRITYFLAFLAIAFISIISVFFASTPRSTTVISTEIRSACLHDPPPPYDKIHLNFPEELQKF